ncbi:MAG: hypothetical protein ABI988_04510 [Nitrospirota bacterium]
MRVDFQGRGNVETLPRARIQAMRDGVQLALCVRDVRALGHVLAQQAIPILVGAALPGAVRISNEDLDGEPLGPRRVLGPLCPAIVRQSFPPPGGHGRSVLVKPARALVASVPSLRARRTRRVVRSTSVPTADPLRAPLMRSPSPWPGTVRVTTSAGRSAIDVIVGRWPRRSVPRARGRRAWRA